MNLSEFLRLSGWDTPEPAQASRMALSLDFMTLEMGEQELRRPVSDPSPWLTQGKRTALKVMQLMQAISFDAPVRTGYLPAGWRLICYRTFNAPTDRPGNYYTLPGSPSTRLAVARNQFVAWSAVLTSPSTCLISKVGDAYVDWARDRGVPPDYRRGSAPQFFIPLPKRTISLSAL